MGIDSLIGNRIGIRIDICTVGFVEFGLGIGFGWAIGFELGIGVEVDIVDIVDIIVVWFVGIVVVGVGILVRAGSVG